MYEQLSIFDWMPTACTPTAYPDIKNISEAEAVRIVGEEIGMTFAYNDRFREWQAKRGKLKLSMEYGHFNLNDNHDLFLGVGYAFGTDGGGSPSNGIEAAIKYFERVKERYA